MSLFQILPIPPSLLSVKCQNCYKWEKLPRGELNFFLSSFFLALLLCFFPSRLGIRVDTRVSFVQNSRYFQAKQVSYFAIKFSLFREISCFAKLALACKSQFRMFCISRNRALAYETK